MAKRVLAVYDKPADRTALEWCEEAAKEISLKFRKSVPFEFVCSDILFLEKAAFENFVEGEHCFSILYCGKINHKLLINASALVSPKVKGLFCGKTQIYAPVCDIKHEAENGFARDTMTVPDENTKCCVETAKRFCRHGKITYLHGAACAAQEKLRAELERCLLKYKSAMCEVSSFASEDEIRNVVVTTPALFNITALSGKMNSLSLAGGKYNIYAPTDSNDFCSLLYAYSTLLRGELLRSNCGEWLQNTLDSVSARGLSARPEIAAAITEALNEISNDRRAENEF